MTDPIGQQVSETAKCKCGHDKEIHDWEHGCQHMAGAGPKWMCRCMDFEPAEPVAVPPAPPEIPTARIPKRWQKVYDRLLAVHDRGVEDTRMDLQLMEELGAAEDMLTSVEVLVDFMFKYARVHPKWESSATVESAQREIRRALEGKRA